LRTPTIQKGEWEDDDNQLQHFIWRIGGFV
jgi:hypothetical protein